ncbi:MAG TPA: hypothetical protein VM915_17255, partial [Verrucomicrobiae bacterium]|nr:hypothetical protein [Verrucomicrobiae bacterium]
MRWKVCGAFCWLCLFVVAAPILAADQVRERRIDRSPVDLVLGPAAKWLVTVNQTSHTASLVDVASDKVLDEIDVGRYPISVICDGVGERIYLSCRDAGEVQIFKVAGGRLQADGVIKVGFHPHG